jgi:hypothetical protein
MHSQIFVWLLRRLSWNRPVRPSPIMAAIAALLADDISVTPCGDDFQHWQMGDFIMTEAAVIQYAVSIGAIGERDLLRPTAGRIHPQ